MQLKRITATEQIELGQVLGADVLGSDGSIVVRSGTILDERVVAQLRAASVSKVMVELTEGKIFELMSEPPKATDPVMRFALNDLSHPLIAKLVEVSRES